MIMQSLKEQIENLYPEAVVEQHGGFLRIYHSKYSMIDSIIMLPATDIGYFNDKKPMLDWFFSLDFDMREWLWSLEEPLWTLYSNRDSVEELLIEEAFYDRFSMVISDTPLKDEAKLLISSMLNDEVAIAWLVEALQDEGYLVDSDGIHFVMDETLYVIKIVHNDGDPYPESGEQISDEDAEGENKDG